MAGTTPLFDRKSGKWIEVADAEIQSKVAAGSHAYGQGIDIPVVAPDGELMYIPSDKAEEAFRDGFRPQTSQDLKADTERKTQAIKDKAYADSTAVATAAGALRGATFGLSDVVLDKFGLAEEAREVKERNPKASLAGTIGGALASAPIMGGAALASSAGAKAGAALTAAAGTSRAAQIAKSIVPAATGSAVEGAFYGLGEGISEAALGDPKEVVENIMSNVGLGAMFGGVFGGAFQGVRDASPFLKDVAKATYSKIDDVVGATARKLTKSGLIPTLSLKGEKQLAEDAAMLIDDPALRKILMDDPNAYKEISGLAAKAQKDAKRAINEMDASVRANMAALSRQEKAAVGDALAEVGGDLQAAAAKGYATLKEADATFRQAMADVRTPAVYADLIYNDTQKMIAKLRNSGKKEASELANELKAVIDAKIPATAASIKNPIERGAAIKNLLTEGDDAILALNLRETLKNASNVIGSMGEEGVKSVSRYSDTLARNMLEAHPNSLIAEGAKNLLAKRSLLDNLVTASAGGSPSALRKVFANPELSEKLTAVLNNLPDLAPEMATLSGKAANAKARAEALSSVQAKMQGLLGSKPSIDDVEQIMGLLKAPGKSFDNLEKLRALSSEFQAAADLSPINKYMRLQRALGRDVSKEMEQLATLEPAYEALNRLKPKGEASVNTVKDMLRIPRALGAGMIHPALGTIVAGIETAGAVAGNPYRAIKGLTAVEKFSNQAAKKLDAATRKAVDGLTSPVVRKAALIAGATTYGDRRTYEERKLEYQRKERLLRQMADPAQAHAYISERVPELPGAPMVQAQLAAQLMQTSTFLATKLPEDPLMGTGLTQTGYLPSDMEMAKFARYVNAAENPLSVVEKSGNGAATPEEIETLKVLYPTIYSRLQEQVLNAIVEKGDKLTYQQRIAVGTLLDIPADATLSPQFIASMQGQYAKEDQDQGGRPPGKSLKIDLDPIANIQTETARITNK